MLTDQMIDTNGIEQDDNTAQIKLPNPHYNLITEKGWNQTSRIQYFFMKLSISKTEWHWEALSA